MAKLVMVMVTGAVAAAHEAAAQGPIEPPPEVAATEHLGEWEISLSGGYVHQFDTDPTGRDSFDVDRFGASLGFQTRITPDLSMTARFNYSLDMYDFGAGANPFGGVPGVNPWEDIHTITAGAVFSLDVTDDINLFGGPVVQIARESGADWDNAWAGGGVMGGSYALSPKFRLGAGVGLFSEIEDDDLKVFFIPVVEWQINDTLRLSSSSSNSISRLGISMTGVELIWTASEQFELALGFGYSYSRFRLDDSGPAASGAGQDESYPLWFRAIWNVSDRFEIDGVTGVLLDGELTLIRSSATTFGSVNYDPAFFAGVFGVFRF
jgi:opacity protein-like surface antigen